MSATTCTTSSRAAGVGDSLNGGVGNDMQSYASSAASVTVNLGTGSVSGGDATGDTFTSFRDLRGSGQADTLTGDGNNNRIEGGDGNDELDGQRRHDDLYGGVSNDV